MTVGDGGDASVLALGLSLLTPKQYDASSTSPPRIVDGVSVASDQKRSPSSPPPSPSTVISKKKQRQTKKRAPPLAADAPGKSSPTAAIKYTFRRLRLFDNKRVAVVWDDGSETQELIANVQEDIGIHDFNLWMDICKLPPDLQEAELVARENASTRSMRRRQTATESSSVVARYAPGPAVGGQSGRHSSTCSYCPSSKVPLMFPCVEDGCTVTICTNCVKHANGALPADVDGWWYTRFRCTSHGGTVKVERHPLRAIYAKDTSSPCVSSLISLRVAVYTLSGDPRGWAPRLRAAGMQVVLVDFRQPNVHGEFDIVISDYHSDPDTGNAAVHQSCVAVTQVAMSCHRVSASTKLHVRLTCGGWKLQQDALVKMSAEQHPQVLFLEFGLGRMIVDEPLMHRVIHACKDMLTDAAKTPEAALDVHFSPAHARVYRPSLLRGGRFLSIGVDAMPLASPSSAAGGSYSYGKVKKIRKHRGNNNALNHRGGHPASVATRQLSAMEKLSSSPQVHPKVLHLLPPDGRGLYFKAHVAGLGRQLLVFTCCGLGANGESSKEWRNRTKHIDYKLARCGVTLLTVHPEDATEICDLIADRSSLDGIDVTRLKVWILQTR